jgi:hypothetical protein
LSAILTVSCGGQKNSISRNNRLETSETIELSEGPVFQAINLPALAETGEGRIAAMDAADELERAVTECGLKGALVSGTIDGKFLDALEFEPVLACAERLDVPLYTHPGVPPEGVRTAYYDGLPGAGSFMLAIGDAWFDLDHQVSKTASDITRYMDSLGLPFLKEFKSYNAVLAVLDKCGSLPFSNEGRSYLVGAMVCVHLKQLERARGYFDRAAAYASANKGFSGHVADLRRECGL